MLKTIVALLLVVWIGRALHRTIKQLRAQDSAGPTEETGAAPAISNATDDKVTLAQRLKTLVDQNNIAALSAELADHDADDLSSAYLFSDQTILMYACESGSADAVEAFLAHGVGFYELKYCDNTEFKSAARNPRHATEILTLLVDATGGHLDDWARTDGDPWGDMDGQGDGLTALDILQSRGDTQAFEYLSEVFRKADLPPEPVVRERAGKPACGDQLWPTDRGIAGSGWGGELAALPASEQRWRYFNKHHRLGSFAKLVFDAEACYFLSQDRAVVCVDANDGAFLWDYVPAKWPPDRYPNSLAICGDVVVADTFVVNRLSGELITDLQQIAPDNTFENHLLMLADDCALRTLNPIERPGEFFKIDHSGNVEIIRLPLQWASLAFGSTVVGGLTVGTPMELAACDIRTGQVQWRVSDVDSGWLMALGDWVCVNGKNSVTVVGARTGAAASRTYAELIGATGSHLPMAISPSGIYLSHGQKVSALDFDLTPIWHRDIDGGRHPLGGIRSLTTAGDWVFVVPRHYHEIVALTRDTGKQVWRSARRHDPWSLQASGTLMVLCGIDGGLLGLDCSGGASERLV